MTSHILLTGGTGTLGRHVTPLLLDSGSKLRLLSRRKRERESANGIEYVVGDLLKGEGIDAAVDGVETILHLAGGPKGDDIATRNLVAAARQAGARHIVLISVTGADRVPVGYVKAKLGAERALAGSGVPWTVLRAAQFHDLVLGAARALAKSPVVPVPSGIRLQPVDSREVAARLVELALGGPAGRVPDMVGPKVYQADELMRGYLRASGKRRLLVPVRLPGAAGRSYRDGENLTLDGATFGQRTWEEFLLAAMP